MAKIIVFSNRKGGTGKSTLCIQFANYLVAHGNNVIVLDADPQQSIVDLRKREVETNPDVALPWQVFYIGDKVDEYINKVRSMGNGYVLIDCPGAITQSLMPVYAAADAVVIPFRYDDLIVDSTITFVKVLKKAGVKAHLLFLPNNIDIRIKNPNEEHVKEIFRSVGTVLPRIKQGVAVQRCSTLCPINQYQELAVEYAVEGILAKLT